jgi:hypothetical protein
MECECDAVYWNEYNRVIQCHRCGDAKTGTPPKMGCGCDASIVYCPKHDPKHVDRLVEAVRKMVEGAETPIADREETSMYFTCDEVDAVKDALRPFVEGEKKEELGI